MSNKIHEKCGHPEAWMLRLVFNGRAFTYCSGCLVEKAGLDNLEAYTNPFIKMDVKGKIVTTTKEKKIKE